MCPWMHYGNWSEEEEFQLEYSKWTDAEESTGQCSREAGSMLSNHKKNMAEEAVEEKMNSMASKRVSTNIMFVDIIHRPVLI
jgi:hypothetical protein